MSLQNKVVLISGGTGGLGRTVVDLLLQEKARVITTYNRDSSYEELIESVSSPENLTGYQVDLTRENEVDTFFDEIQTTHKSIDIFIHLAGSFWMGGTIAETPIKQWTKMIDTNLNSSFFTCRRSFRLMQSGNGGHIITISAKPALELTAGMGAYAVSKAAVLALTDVLAKEGSCFDIRANCILPGVIDTLDNREAMPEADFSNWITTREIADTILSLINNSGISGSVIKMYGKI